MTSNVWVKLRGSRDDAFRVEVGPNAIIDDLKNAISAKEMVKIEYIYSAEQSKEHKEEDEKDVSKCRASHKILSHGEAGSSEENPYYYTIASPAIQPQPGKYWFPIMSDVLQTN